MNHRMIAVMAALVLATTQAQAGLFGNDSDADARAHADADARAGAIAASKSGVYGSGNSESTAHGEYDQDQVQVQTQGQDQGIEAFNGNTTVVNPDLGDGIASAGEDLAKAHQRHAERAPDPASAYANGCDTTSVTGQGGLFGGGFSTPTFPCEVLRTKLVEDAIGGGMFNGVLKAQLRFRLFVRGFLGLIPGLG